MIQLTESNVQLHARATSKDEAIRQVGRLLVQGGYIAPGYVESMLGRELQANTYLGNGIAIPHGMGKDRDLIQRTGIAVAQFPEGVEWRPGETVRLVVGIAAKSDEHLAILANLVDVLDDAEKAQRLARTDDPREIISALSRARSNGSSAATSATDVPADARAVEVQVLNKAGLHARPATAFVELASGFASEVRVEYQDKTANGKALASLLRLGVEGGATIRIVAWGADADAAVQTLRAAVESGLEEAEEQEQVAEAVAWTPVSALRTLTGIAAAPGLALGPLYQIQSNRIVVTDQPQDGETERRRMRQALETAREQLDDVYESVKARSGRSEAAIFRAHQVLLGDPELIGEVDALVLAGHSAAWAWQHAIEERIADVRRVQDERLAARAVDLHDVGQRVLRLMAGVEHGESQMPDAPVILVADDLTPSDTARLDPKRTLGICTASGGPTSHTAIIARSLDIPAVVGAGAALLEQAEGTVCVLDGGAGVLYVEPSEVDLASARQAQAELERLRDAEYQTRYQPAVMTDGERVEVVANIGKAAEAAQAVDAGAEGVGLLRTEFLFLERAEPPSEEEQLAAYTEMTRALNGLPLIIRTLDIGGDKALPYLSLPPETNPFLGVRGIRLCFRKPELFTPQLRAIYRAAASGPIKLMFPMVATLEELREAKAIAARAPPDANGPAADPPPTAA